MPGPTTHANRGRLFEQQLSVVHDMYMRQGRAYVIRNAAPIRQVGRVQPNGTFLASHIGEGPPDFLVCAQGRTFVIEAKQCQSKRWAFSNLKDHQAAQMDAAEVQGAVGVILLRWTVAHGGRTFILLWSDLRNLWHPWRLGAARQASVSYEQCMEQVGAWDSAGCDYLNGLLMVAGPGMDEPLTPRDYIHRELLPVHDPCTNCGATMVLTADALTCLTCDQP